jgi:hypothetical protein
VSNAAGFHLHARCELKDEGVEIQLSTFTVLFRVSYYKQCSKFVTEIKQLLQNKQIILK